MVKWTRDKNKLLPQLLVTCPKPKSISPTAAPLSLSQILQIARWIYFEIEWRSQLKGPNSSSGLFSLKKGIPKFRCLSALLKIDNSLKFENIWSKLRVCLTFKNEMGKYLALHKLGIWDEDWGGGGADSEAHILSHCEPDRFLEWSWILEERRIYRGLHGTAFPTNLFQTTLFIQYLCAIKRSLSRKYPFKVSELSFVFVTLILRNTSHCEERDFHLPLFRNCALELFWRDKEEMRCPVLRWSARYCWMQKLNVT